MARVKQGDFIKVVDSDMAGYCVEIKDDGTLIVETTDGLIVPVKGIRYVISEFDQNLSEAPVGSSRNKKKTQGRSRVQNKSGRKQPTGSSQVIEIDLHTSLKPDVKAGPLPSDILSIQLDRFAAALRKAVNDNKRELVAIHGEGSGRLRSEIRRISRELFPNLEVMDAAYHKYGNGATRIIIKP